VAEQAPPPARKPPRRQRQRTGEVPVPEAGAPSEAVAAPQADVRAGIPPQGVRRGGGRRRKSAEVAPTPAEAEAVVPASEPAQGEAPAKRGRRRRGPRPARAGAEGAPEAAFAAPAVDSERELPSPPDGAPAKRRRRGKRGGRRHRRKGAAAVAAAPVPAAAPPAPAAAAGPPPVAARPRRRRRKGSGAATAPAPASTAPVADLAEALGIRVREERWFRQALYHASYVNERGSPGISSNERLEFLGDAVLDLAVGQYLFERYPDMAEGDLSRLRAAVVRASTLAARGKAMGLGRFALLGKGEERSGGRRRPNFLADLLEALIGAIFLDQGIGAATEFVLSALRPDLDAAAEGYEHANYKAQLQDAVQKDGRLPVTYAVVSAEGPQHARVWQCEVRIGGRRCGLGQGRTKRAAEQEAAREALLRGWNHSQA
jgi:ribonuclease-3